ncbi:glucose-regulated protein precursor [Apiospora hydei]|uniref:Glucose-regulated protein n=1 Tax=Apiospora hydei TaxID=1337664 RepID=A0ABR1UT39_9PEZI
MTSTEIREFDPTIPTEEVERLWRRLRDTRLPETPVVPDAGDDYGPPLDWVHKLFAKWRDDFDWDAAQRRICRWKHYTTTIEDLRVHFVHQPAAKKHWQHRAIPLLLVHGWPGSWYEFSRENGAQGMTDWWLGTPRHEAHMGYAVEMRTRPQTIGLALSDSPLGLLARDFVDDVHDPVPLILHRAQHHDVGALLHQQRAARELYGVQRAAGERDSGAVWGVELSNMNTEGILLRWKSRRSLSRSPGPQRLFHCDLARGVEGCGIVGVSNIIPHHKRTLYPMLQIRPLRMRASMIALIAGACLLFSPLASAEVDDPYGYGNVIGIPTPTTGPGSSTLRAAASPSNTVFNSRLFLGRNFNDSQVQTGLSRFPYKVIDQAGKPVFEVELPTGHVQQVTPEEVTAVIIRNMRDIAESYLQAVKDAGTIAKLNVLRILNEPTAACIAYGLETIAETELTIMVYDIGARTTDTTLLTVEDGIYEILAHDTIQFGGHDFNQRIIDYLTTNFNTKASVDVTHDHKAMNRLMHAVEGAKRSLSKSMTTRIEIPDFFQGKTLSETLTRAKFEELNLDLLHQILGPTSRVLSNAGVQREGITHVVLAGAFMRHQTRRGHRFWCRSSGWCAVQRRRDEQLPSDVRLQQSIPERRDRRRSGGQDAPRGTPVPSRNTRVFTTALDNQSTFKLRIVLGERPLAKDNPFAGLFEFPIPPAPRGVPRIRVSIGTDGTGLLDVTADDEASGARLFSASIRPNVDFTVDSKIADHHMDVAQRYANEDTAAYERVKAELGRENLGGVLAVSGQGPVVKTDVRDGEPLIMRVSQGRGKGRLKNQTPPSYLQQI